jgi:hypothetical protein
MERKREPSTVLGDHGFGARYSFGITKPASQGFQERTG